MNHSVSATSSNCNHWTKDFDWDWKLLRQKNSFGMHGVCQNYWWQYWMLCKVSTFYRLRQLSICHNTVRAKLRVAERKLVRSPQIWETLQPHHMHPGESHAWPLSGYYLALIFINESEPWDENKILLCSRWQMMFSGKGRQCGLDLHRPWLL